MVSSSGNFDSSRLYFLLLIHSSFEVYNLKMMTLMRQKINNIWKLLVCWLYVCMFLYEACFSWVHVIMPLKSMEFFLLQKSIHANIFRRCILNKQSEQRSRLYNIKEKIRPSVFYHRHHLHRASDITSQFCVAKNELWVIYCCLHVVQGAITKGHGNMLIKIAVSLKISLVKEHLVEYTDARLCLEAEAGFAVSGKSLYRAIRSLDAKFYWNQFC